MADFEGIIRQHAGEDGSIPSGAIGAIVTAIKTAVGNEFVDKERYKAKLTEIDTLKEQQQTAEDNATTAEKWKTKYEAMKSDFEQYKADQSAKETLEAKQTAYRALLKECGVSEKRLETVLKVSDMDKLKLDKDGKFEGYDDLKKNVAEEWADFIETKGEQGAETPTPPANNGSEKPFVSNAAKRVAEYRANLYGTLPTKEV